MLSAKLSLTTEKMYGPSRTSVLCECRDKWRSAAVIDTVTVFERFEYIIVYEMMHEFIPDHGDAFLRLVAFVFQTGLYSPND